MTRKKDKGREESMCILFKVGKRRGTVPRGAISWGKKTSKKGVKSFGRAGFKKTLGGLCLPGKK